MWKEERAPSFHSPTGRGRPQGLQPPPPLGASRVRAAPRRPEIFSRRVAPSLASASTRPRPAPLRSDTRRRREPKRASGLLSLKAPSEGSHACGGLPLRRWPSPSRPASDGPRTPWRDVGPSASSPWPRSAGGPRRGSSSAPAAVDPSEGPDADPRASWERTQDLQGPQSSRGSRCTTLLTGSRGGSPRSPDVGAPDGPAGPASVRLVQAPSPPTRAGRRSERRVSERT